MSQSRKVAVVTGGASGIGLACAEMFSRTHHVVIGDLKNVEQAAAELPVAGTGVRMAVCSVEGCERLAGTASSLGAVEVLVHCAGILMQPTVRIEEMDPERWRRIIDVNLTGTFLVTRALAPVLADSGSIVLVASRTGRTGSAALRLCEVACSGAGPSRDTGKRHCSRSCKYKPEHAGSRKDALGAYPAWPDRHDGGYYARRGLSLFGGRFMDHRTCS